MLLLLVLALFHTGLAQPLSPISALYHSQDALGQYIYGYATPTSSKTESKTSDGVTRGGYSYLDSNGLLQTVQYIADPVHGFRVAATNLPQDLPEVALAKTRHLQEFAKIAAKNQDLQEFAKIAAKTQQLVPKDLPEVVKARTEHLAALEAAYHGINPVQDLPEVVKARTEHLEAVERTRAAALSPVQVTGNVVVNALPVAQYHVQDGLGQYSYGYVGPWSAKSEEKGVDGVTRGGYSYIDANGVLQTVTYVADGHGFRVAASNLPEVHTQHVVY